MQILTWDTPTLLTDWSFLSSLQLYFSAKRSRSSESCLEMQKIIFLKNQEGKKKGLTHPAKSGSSPISKPKLTTNCFASFFSWMALNHEHKNSENKTTKNKRKTKNEEQRHKSMLCNTCTACSSSSRKSLCRETVQRALVLIPQHWKPSHVQLRNGVYSFYLRESLDYENVLLNTSTVWDMYKLICPLNPHLRSL